MRNFLVMVRATSHHCKGTGYWMYALCQILMLIATLASFLGPRLQGDHHVNKAEMVSLDGRGPSAGH